MILKSQQRFTSEANSIYIEAINKISLSSKDDKRFQTFDRVKHINKAQMMERYF